MKIYSLASKFGDYRCPSEKATLNLSKSIMYLGTLAAFLVGSLIGNYICSRTLVISGLIMNILSLGVTVLADNLWVATVGLFFQTVGMYISYILIFVFATEMVG